MLLVGDQGRQQRRQRVVEIGGEEVDRRIVQFIVSPRRATRTRVCKIEHICASPAGGLAARVAVHRGTVDDRAAGSSM
jgi:hypothetical protein